MKKALAVLVITFVVSLNIIYAAPFPAHVEKALRYGANAKVVFQILDDEGRAVKDAHVGMGYDESSQDSNLTDEKGMCSLEVKTIGEIYYGVKKDGYYTSHGQIKFYNRKDWGKCVKDDKWQPYGATQTVILKPKKKPIPMTSYWYETSPETLTQPITSPIGFDLQVGDLVKPYGKGVVSDFLFSQEVKDGRNFATMTFPNPQDGGYIKEKDEFSAFVSDYQAATNNVYLSEFVFDRKSEGLKIFFDTTLTKKQYLVLRTRTKVNEKGEVIEAYYSKLYGSASFTHPSCPVYLRLQAFVNLTPNDTNLEFDPKKNLYKPPYRNVSNPYYILNECYP